MGRTRKGFEGGLYRNTGSYASPSWNVIDRVGDVTITDEKEEVDTWSRADGQLKTSEPGGRMVSAEFSILEDNSDADQAALRVAYEYDNPIEFLFVNGKVDHAGCRGIRVTCMVQKFSQPQPIGGNIVREVVIKPCPSTNAGVTAYSDSGTTTTTSA